jgi:uncharacterized peroxidase-related enzyme
MSRIEILTPANRTESVASTLESVRAKLGVVPNLFATFANSPAVLNGYIALSESLNHGELKASQREIIALAVGQANSCQYCLSAHSLMAKGVGLSKKAISNARAGHADDPLTDALTKLAVNIVNKRGQLDEQDIQSARASGVTDAQLIEVIGLVALNTLTNYTNHIAQTDIDFPLVDV